MTEAEKTKTDQEQSRVQELLQDKAIRLPLVWLIIPLASYGSWKLFLSAGPFEGDTNVVCGYFGTVCLVNSALALYTIFFLDRFISEKLAERRAAVAPLPETPAEDGSKSCEKAESEVESTDEGETGGVAVSADGKAGDSGSASGDETATGDEAPMRPKWDEL